MMEELHRLSRCTRTRKAHQRGESITRIWAAAKQLSLTPGAMTSPTMNLQQSDNEPRDTKEEKDGKVEKVES
jgi:hypothetical protein